VRVAAGPNTFGRGVAVRCDLFTQKLCVASHGIWHPTPDEPLNMERTIEWFIQELCDRNRIE
jgi:hypothetical protein